MLKVECDSCKASYPIDERRVPPAGPKMRCPKCGHSFLVTNPAAPAGAELPRTPTVTGAAPPPRSPAVAALKRTMVGVGGGGAPQPPPAAAPRPPPPAPPAPPPQAPPVPPA